MTDTVEKIREFVEADHANDYEELAKDRTGLNDYDVSSDDATRYFNESLKALNELLNEGDIRSAIPPKELKQISDFVVKIEDALSAKHQPRNRKSQSSTNKIKHAHNAVLSIYSILYSLQLVESPEKMDLETKLGEIQGIHERAKENEKEISETLRQLKDGELATAFDRQADTLWRTRRFWVRVAIVLNLSFLIGGIFLVIEFGDALFPPDAGVAASFGRLSLVIPVLFLQYVVIRQLGQASSLHHQYRFKATIASTLNSYHDYISRTSEDSLGAAFFMSSVDKLYEPPRVSLIKDPGNDGKEETRRLYDYIRRHRAVPNE